MEGCLLDAMYKLAIINEEQRKQPYLFYFQRAARTDRAVSAVRQVSLLPFSNIFHLRYNK